MNILKYFLIFGIFLLSFPNNVNAKETTYLVITQYESAKDQPALIQNNETIFEFYENIEGNPPVMLSVMTEAQKDTLLAKGFKLQIVEENPDMTFYRLLYNPVANQASKLAFTGKIYTLTKNHTLVRLNEETEINLTGSLAQFTNVPLQNIGIQSMSAAALEQNKMEELSANNPNRTIIGSIIMILLFLFIIGVFIYLKKNRKQVS